MSSFIYSHLAERFLSFGQYILSESILPVATAYGSNDSMDDGKWKQLDSHTKGTFTSINGKFYCVMTNSENYVGFIASDTHSLNPHDYSDARMTTSNSLTVFGKILFVLLSAELREVKFDAANAKLGKVYDRMVKNKPLIDYLRGRGWTYDGVEDDSYVFRRK